MSERSGKGASGLRAAIIAGGHLRVGDRVRGVLDSADFLIAADRGIERCLEMGLVPDLAVGDFDSVTPAALETARARVGRSRPTRRKKTPPTARSRCGRRWPEVPAT